MEANGPPQVKHKDTRENEPDLNLFHIQIWVYGLSCFLVLTEAPLDGSHGTWVVWSERGTPRPWVEMPFPPQPGSLTIGQGGANEHAHPCFYSVILHAQRRGRGEEQDQVDCVFYVGTRRFNNLKHHPLADPTHTGGGGAGDAFMQQATNYFCKLLWGHQKADGLQQQLCSYGAPMGKHPTHPGRQ